jgi:hypothetical protein
MEEYSNYLTNIKYPINYNRPSLKNNPEEVHRGLALGLVGIRPLYRKYKEETHRECCALQYNWNQKSAKHKDKNNVGESYIIALGDYEGGRLKVWHNDNEEPEYVDIKNKFFKFNGAKLYHETEDFTGTRLSLVFFNLLNKD